MNSYNLLKSFKYTKFHQIIFVLVFLAIFIIPAFFAIQGLLSPFLFSAITIALFVCGQIFENKVLWQTEIIGQIFIDLDFIKFENKQFNFNEISSLTISKYASPYTSFIPHWKHSNKLEFKLNSGKEYSFFLSANHSQQTKKIFDLFEDIKKTNIETHKKIRIYT